MVLTSQGSFYIAKLVTPKASENYHHIFTTKGKMFENQLIQQSV